MQQGRRLPSGERRPHPDMAQCASQAPRFNARPDPPGSGRLEFCLTRYRYLVLDRAWIGARREPHGLEPQVTVGTETAVIRTRRVAPAVTR
jgi:hypothetical protein